MGVLTAKEKISLLQRSKGVWCWDNPYPTEHVAEWNEWRRQNRDIKPCLDGVDLSDLNLSYANFRESSLKGTDFSRCQLVETDFVRSHLQKSKFIGAYLYGALLDQADLSNAELMNSTLWWTTLVQTKLRGADISGSRVYGVSPWDVDLEATRQNDLDISRPDCYETKLTVHDLEVAHFMHLLVDNRKIRNVIDTATSKVVLILGRFTPARKAVLDALREELRKYDLVPIVFDFDQPASKNLTETIATLANLARIVIADLTDPKSIPQELQRIVPHNPSLPVQPIIHCSQDPYAMFGDLLDYDWVLEPHEYEALDDLLAEITGSLIEPALAEAKRIQNRRQARKRYRQKKGRRKGLRDMSSH